MKVGELREMLKGMSDDIEIVITSTDPTDYTYINNIVSVKEGYVLGSDEQYISDEDDCEESGKPVLVIDGGEV
tara:strand:- start:5 stop:223 length:219 start_codon:yes stop_codon:yes gene_type:complete